MRSNARNVWLLAACQALFMTGQSMMIMLGGLVGATLAPDGALATLPVSAAVVGMVTATIPASLLMKRLGRRGGFLIGASIGAVGGALAAYAIVIQAFVPLVSGTFLAGIAGGFAQYYRFAAADIASEETRGRAISLVLAGGVVAAVAGPHLVTLTIDMLAYTFVASYLVVAALPILSMGLLTFLDIPMLDPGTIREPGRPLHRIARQPTFIVAVLGGTVGYSTMSLIMTSTPLAMVGCGFGVADAASVIQWHVLAMFAPSFFTGSLIKRFGVLNVMLAGMVLLFACVAVDLAGVDFLNFAVGLAILGLGWNFAFVGASTLLTETHSPAERAKVQATNDFLVFGSVATASLSSGAFLHFLGWNAVQILALPFVTVATLGLLWLRFRPADE